jgi:hypothetical protein
MQTWLFFNANASWATQTCLSGLFAGTLVLFFNFIFCFFSFVFQFYLSTFDLF